MVLENFYEIISKETLEDNSSFNIQIKVNSLHPIFKGHFPDNPVMPGVCMLQIIKEITEEIVKSKLFMQKCVNVKFLALINPELNSVLQLQLNISQNEGIVKVKSTAKFDDTLALKMSAEYRIV
jgi:3-hydroxyacyl-[acyl-carrier-protein] dehydratase